MNPMRHLRPLLFAVALAALPFIAACGGDGKSPSQTATNNGDEPEITPSGPVLNDQQYLSTLCVGLVNYYDALMTEPTRDGIAKVVKEFVGSMKAVNPPEDVVPFHREFIAYLSAAVDEPTSLVTVAPPKPEDSIRERLAARVNDTPECKYPTFLGEPRKP
jgi:hypothetical protein